MKEWDHKDEWRMPGDKFTVTVTRHNGCDGVNKWAVYVFIYPDHRLFNLFDDCGDMRNQPDMPGHGGISKYQVHRAKDWSVCSHEVGFDYSHLYDDHYGLMKTKEDAAIIFMDAEELHTFLGGEE